MITQLFVSAGRYLLTRCKRCLGEFDYMSRIIFLSTMFLLIIAAHAFPPSLRALGPWKGQVVDAETKQPLQGVTVVAGWYRHWPDFNGLPTFGYVASEQVVTDKHGKFTIKTPSLIRSDPIVLEEPEFHFFKPGYERWRFQGEEGPLRLNVRERKLPRQEAMRQPQDKGIVIELVPRKALEEQLMFHGNPGRAAPGPSDTLERIDDVECVPLDKEEWRNRLIPWVPDDDESVHCPADQTKREK
jgi:hypothetical protein